MNYQYGTPTTTLTYPQLIMKQIERIQNICSKELRDATNIIKTPIGEQVYDNEDTRYSFLQSVELLGSLLNPYFNKNKAKNVDVQEEFEKFVNFYDMELIEALNNQEFTKSIKDRFDLVIDIKKIDSKTKQELLTYLLTEKCKYGRKIFRILIQCFKDNDFLANESFTDSSSSGSDNGLEADGDDFEEEIIE